MPPESGDLQAFQFRRYGWFSFRALSGLVTLTFDLLISKWGHGTGLPVSWASFLPVFSLLRPFIQTDRQTTINV